jgi:hypothetical protein
VPLYQGSFNVDSKWDDWWSVGFSLVDDGFKMKRVSFGAHEALTDDLRVGRCGIDELPAWLAATAKKLKISWNTRALVSGSLRGKKRDQLIAWLFPKPPKKK